MKISQSTIFLRFFPMEYSKLKIKKNRSPKNIERNSTSDDPSQIRKRKLFAKSFDGERDETQHVHSERFLHGELLLGNRDAVRTPAPAQERVRYADRAPAQQRFRQTHARTAGQRHRLTPKRYAVR